jgi:hypothetical protein
MICQFVFGSCVRLTTEVLLLLLLLPLLLRAPILPSLHQKDHSRCGGEFLEWISHPCIQPGFPRHANRVWMVPPTHSHQLETPSGQNIVNSSRSPITITMTVIITLVHNQIQNKQDGKQILPVITSDISDVMALDHPRSFSKPSLHPPSSTPPFALSLLHFHVAYTCGG